MGIISTQKFQFRLLAGEGQKVQLDLFQDEDIKVSDLPDAANSMTNTRIALASAVYLAPGFEYALVVISDSAKYKIWLAQTGEVDINGSGLISEQPYAGVLFKSQNASTWTADQNQDMKFNINRAVFDTSSTASLNLINQHVNSDTYYDLANINVNKIVLPGTSVTSFMNNVNAVTGNNIANAGGINMQVYFPLENKKINPSNPL